MVVGAEKVWSTRDGREELSSVKFDDVLMATAYRTFSIGSRSFPYHRSAYDAGSGILANAGLGLTLIDVSDPGGLRAVERPGMLEGREEAGDGTERRTQWMVVGGDRVYLQEVDTLRTWMDGRWLLVECATPEMGWVDVYEVTVEEEG